MFLKVDFRSQNEAFAPILDILKIFLQNLETATFTHFLMLLS